MSEILGPVQLLESSMDARNFLLGCIAFAIAALCLGSIIWLSRINTQLERQTIAAEQANKLLQEPGAMSQELGELVKVLKEFQAMAAAEAASSPKR